MKNELEDRKLKALFRDFKPESPAEGFSLRVMERINMEQHSLEKIKSERLLGKGFWIITVLFVLLLATVFFLSNAGMETGNSIPEILPNLQTQFSEGYGSFFAKLGNAPLSIAGIFLASSVLLFIDRFVNSHPKALA